MNDSIKTIVVAEPQCWGGEHAPVNAAFLATINLAYNTARIMFYGEKTHLFQVKMILMQRDLNLDNFFFSPCKVPVRKMGGMNRFVTEISWYNRLIEKSYNMKPYVYIFLSTTNTGLFAIKILKHYRYAGLRIVTILHGCLALLEQVQPRRPWDWVLNIKQVLAFPHPRTLKFVVLGSSILKNVKKYQQSKNRMHWYALDHVYFWPKDIQLEQNITNNNNPIKFGYLGTSHKGFDMFLRIAEEIMPPKKEAQFLMVGFYNGQPENKPVSDLIPNISDVRLSRDRFEKQVNELSYIVMTVNPEHYKLTASGTFLDACAFLKPGIYLRNEYFVHYFNKLGDIGFLCDNISEMVETIREIITEFPFERYQQQVANLKKGRTIFEPKIIAPQFRKILQGLL